MIPAARTDTEFARQGHYSRLWFDLNEEEIHEFSLQEFSLQSNEFPLQKWKRYVVVHLRNQIGNPEKSEAKNIKSNYAFLIFKLLQNRFRAGVIDGVVIVGNDSTEGFEIETIKGIIDDNLPILDLRNKWTGSVEKIHEFSVQDRDYGLKEIAWICKNAVMTIGRDSGIIQLAGAAGCRKLVSWDFVTPGWFPKVKPGVLSAWVTRESSIEKVLEAINLGLN